MKHNQSRGFTLIEVVAVVAIIAILAAIAIPSYAVYARKAHRQSVMTKMLDMQAVMENNFSNTGSYSRAQASALVDGDGTTTLPALPYPTANSKYNITFTPVNGNNTFMSYTMTAVPIGKQAQDSCGTLGLTSTGIKSSAGTAAKCW